MYSKGNQGLLFPEELLKEIREKFYHVEFDPITKRRRLFFDNAGGSYRLKEASDRFKAVDELPNCPGHGGATSDYLKALRGKAIEDVKIMFNAKGGAIMTSMTASIVLFDIIEAIIECVPGTNIVTTELEHPCVFDSCEIYAKKFGKELRVAKTNPKTGSIEVEEIVNLIDKNTCLASVIMTSNITGAVLDIESIVHECRKKNSEVYIVCDSVQHTPHGAFDLKKCPVDAVGFAAYKFGGVRGLGIGWFSERAATLPHRRLIKERVDNWEMGGCAPGHYAQLSAIVDYVCWIGSKFISSNNRRELYLEGMHRIELHERALLYRMLNGSEKVPGLRNIPGVILYVDTDDLTKRDLIVPLGFENMTPKEVAARYEEEGIVIHERVDSSLYSVRQLHSFNTHGIARISPFHCNNTDEIDYFLVTTEKMAKMKK